MYRRGVYRFLLTRQWVILTVVAIALIPTMIRLGFWQMHRYEERSARNQLVTDALNSAPVPVERLTSPGHTVTKDQRYRNVTATGRFDTGHAIFHSATGGGLACASCHPEGGDELCTPDRRPRAAHESLPGAAAGAASA